MKQKVISYLRKRSEILIILVDFYVNLALFFLLPLSGSTFPDASFLLFPVTIHLTTNEELYALLISRFKCDVCNKDFSRNDNLKSHLKTIHGVIVPPKPKSSS